MRVVQDQRHRRVLGRQRPREPQQQDVAGVRSPRGGQRRRQGHTGPAQRRDDIGPEDPRPVIELIHADPGHHPGPGRRPQRQGRRLARARRAGDNSQRAPPRTLHDQLGDPRPRHGPARHTRHGDLSRHDRNAGGNCRPSGAGRHLLRDMGRHRDLPGSLPRPAAIRSLAIGDHTLGCRPDRHVRPARRAPRPHNHEMPAGRAAHRAIGMKSEPRQLRSRTASSVVIVCTSSSTRLTPSGREELSVTVRFLERRCDVIPERDRHIGSGGGDSAEPGYRGDRQQHVSDLVLGSARRQRPADGPSQAQRR